jgi:hypothetical protein
MSARWSSRCKTLAAAAAGLASLCLPSAAPGAPRAVAAQLARAAAPASALHLRSVRHSFGTAFYRFQQEVGGVPVLGGEAIVATEPGSRAELLADTSRAAIDHTLPATVPAASAIAVGRARTRASALRLPARATAAILPTSGGGRLVWRVTLASGRPFADFEVLIDARTAAVVRLRNLLKRLTGSARIFDPNPVQTQNGFTGLADNNDADSARLTALRLPVTLPRMPSSGCLNGHWAHAVIPLVQTVDDFEYPDGSDNPSPPQEVCQSGGDFTAVTRSQDVFEAVMGYFHIDRAQSYVQSLGFSNGRHNGIVDRQILVKADYESDDNSAYSPFERSLTLGVGGVDDGEDAGVFVHEYGHAVQDSESPDFGGAGGGQAGAMQEGFADYFAQTVLTHFRPSRRWEACWSPWDNTGIAPWVHCERRVDEARSPAQLMARGPRDHTEDAGSCRQDVHCMGEAWSGALWAVRRHMGQNRALQLVLQSQFAYTSSTDFNGGSRALIGADRQLHRGHNRRFLVTLLCKRALLRSGCPRPRRR